MTQEIAGSMMMALMVVGLGLALWGWRRRGARYRGEAEALIRDIPASVALVDIDALYVATTEALDPLQRIAAGPLSYRPKARLALHPEGLLVRIPGEDPVLFPAEGLEAGQALLATSDPQQRAPQVVEGSNVAGNLLEHLLEA